MHRAQLLLEEWQYEQLKSEAESRDESISKVVRDILGEYLRKRSEQGRSRLAGICGIADGPAEAIGLDHDHHLYGAPKRSSKKRS